MIKTTNVPLSLDEMKLGDLITNSSSGGPSSRATRALDREQAEIYRDHTQSQGRKTSLAQDRLQWTCVSLRRVSRMWHSLYPSPSWCRISGCSEERGDGGDSANVKTVAHSDTTSLSSTLSFPSLESSLDSRAQVWRGRELFPRETSSCGLALTSPFDIYCLERLLYRLIADEGITAFMGTTIQCSTV